MKRIRIIALVALAVLLAAVLYLNERQDPCNRIIKAGILVKGGGGDPAVTGPPEPCDNQ